MHKKFSIEQSPRRRAFTLVELLLVITVIAILASLGVGVMAQAQNDAAVAATRSRITLIEKILEVELEDYEVRRSPVSVGDLNELVSGSALSTGRNLLHVRNLRRMIIADLIRTEMPDGSRSGTQVIGRFPSESLATYLSSIGITTDISDPSVFVLSAGAEVVVNPYPQQTLRWNTWLTDWTVRNTPNPGNPVDLTLWPLIDDSVPGDGVFEDAVQRSELLFEILQNIDVDGVPAVELIGSASIADTDGNGFNEIVDAWGEPMFLQWQQEQITLVGSVAENVWQPGVGVAGLSREHPSFGGSFGDFSRPVLPTQVRSFLTSERLHEIDGFPADYLENFAF